MVSGTGKGKGKKKGKRPSKAEIDALRKLLQAVTKDFFDKYGSKPVKVRKAAKSAKSARSADTSEGSGSEGGIDFLMIGQPGPRPPPKLEIEILNLSSY
jgi:hypothetical protein